MQKVVTSVVTVVQETSAQKLQVEAREAVAETVGREMACKESATYS